MSPVYKGDTMTIIYDPANPNSYIEDSWGSTWGATVGLGNTGSKYLTSILSRL